PTYAEDLVAPKGVISNKLIEDLTHILIYE
ncbi:MAG: hypothetical protein RLZZ204_548, partial [Bacteroidota bacterium]